MGTAKLLRFTVREFENARTGSLSFRVSGTGRDGRRIRENFTDLNAARVRQAELETDFQARRGPEDVRFTSLSQEQVKIAESAFLRLEEDSELTRAVDHWLIHGQNAQPTSAPEVSLDMALIEFENWLKTASALSPLTRKNLRLRARKFVAWTGNLAMASVTPERVETFLDARRGVSSTTRRNDRLAISRFFAWCLQRPRRWILHNPAREVRVERKKPSEPEVYSLREVMRLLVASKRFRGGRFLPYIVRQVFCGLRPEEALRVSSDQFNLADAELRLRADQTKTRRPRVVSLEPVAVAWLRQCGDLPVKNPILDRRAWGQLRQKAKFKRWIPDGLRHTAISHRFRQTGSYGLCAEWAGNSEAIIKGHYQGRVTRDECARFWNLFPRREDRHRVISRKVIALPPPPRARRVRRNVAG